MISTIKKKNIFNPIPVILEKEAFESIVKTKTLNIERIVSKGHSSPEYGWHEQEKNEWVIVLKGEAIIAFENEEEIHLEEGDYLNIPARKRHKVVKTDQQQETIWLAVHY